MNSTGAPVGGALAALAAAAAAADTVMSATSASAGGRVPSAMGTGTLPSSRLQPETLQAVPPGTGAGASATDAVDGVMGSDFSVDGVGAFAWLPCASVWDDFLRCVETAPVRRWAALTDAERSAFAAFTKNPDGKHGSKRVEAFFEVCATLSVVRAAGVPATVLDAAGRVVLAREVAPLAVFLCAAAAAAEHSGSVSSRVLPNVVLEKATLLLHSCVPNNADPLSLSRTAIATILRKPFSSGTPTSMSFTALLHHIETQLLLVNRDAHLSLFVPHIPQDWRRYWLDLSPSVLQHVRDGDLHAVFIRKPLLRQALQSMSYCLGGYATRAVRLREDGCLSASAVCTRSAPWPRTSASSPAAPKAAAAVAATSAEADMDSATASAAGAMGAFSVTCDVDEDVGAGGRSSGARKRVAAAAVAHNPESGIATSGADLDMSNAATAAAAAAAAAAATAAAAAAAAAPPPPPRKFATGAFVASMPDAQLLFAGIAAKGRRHLDGGELPRGVGCSSTCSVIYPASSLVQHALVIFTPHIHHLTGQVPILVQQRIAIAARACAASRERGLLCGDACRSSFYKDAIVAARGKSSDLDMVDENDQFNLVHWSLASKIEIARSAHAGRGGNMTGVLVDANRKVVAQYAARAAQTAMVCGTGSHTSVTDPSGLLTWLTPDRAAGGSIWSSQRGANLSGSKRPAAVALGALVGAADAEATSGLRSSASGQPPLLSSATIVTAPTQYAASGGGAPGAPAKSAAADLGAGAGAGAGAADAEATSGLRSSASGRPLLSSATIVTAPTQYAASGGGAPGAPAKSAAADLGAGAGAGAGASSNRCSVCEEGTDVIGGIACSNDTCNYRVCGACFEETTGGIDGELAFLCEGCSPDPAENAETSGIVRSGDFVDTLLQNGWDALLASCPGGMARSRFFLHCVMKLPGYWGPYVRELGAQHIKAVEAVHARHHRGNKTARNTLFDFAQDLASRGWGHLDFKHDNEKLVSLRLWARHPEMARLTRAYDADHVQIVDGTWTVGVKNYHLYVFHGLVPHSGGDAVPLAFLLFYHAPGIDGALTDTLAWAQTCALLDGMAPPLVTIFDKCRASFNASAEVHLGVVHAAIKESAPGIIRDLDEYVKVGGAASAELRNAAVTYLNATPGGDACIPFNPDVFASLPPSRRPLPIEAELVCNAQLLAHPVVRLACFPLPPPPPPPPLPHTHIQLSR